MSARTRDAARAMLRHALACELKGIVILHDPAAPRPRAGGEYCELGSNASRADVISMLEGVLARLKSDAAATAEIQTALALGEPQGKPS